MWNPVQKKVDVYCDPRIVLLHACSNGDLEALKSIKEIPPEDAFYLASFYGQKEILEFLVQKFEGYDLWNLCLCAGFEGGYSGVVDMMVSFGADDLKKGIVHAVKSGRMSMVLLAVDYAKEWLEYDIASTRNVNDMQKAVDWYMSIIRTGMVEASNTEFAEFFYDLGAEDHH